METKQTVTPEEEKDRLLLEEWRLQRQISMAQANINAYPNSWTTATAVPNWTGSILLPFKRVSMGQTAVAEVACRPEELNEYYMFGHKPEVGKQYQLVCTGVEEVNGQIVAKFKLL